MLDTLDMFGAVDRLPDQLATALDAAAGVSGLPAVRDVRSVLVVGMGGSGVAGDVTAAVAAGSCPVPVVVSKGPERPAFVGPDTLVFAVSYSGDTAETLEAARGALDAGALLVAVTSGGQLAALAGDAGAPVVPCDPSIPMPRAAIGAVSVPPLVVLERLGLLDGAIAQVRSAVEQARRRLDPSGSARAEAAALARRIGRTMPIVHGGGPLGDAAARRWKTQVNENPKSPAFASSVPELTHNEVCGWAQHGDVTRQVFSLVQLRHDFEHPGTERRFELVAEIYEEIVAGIHTVRAQGEGPFAQLIDLAVQGDLVSLRMAVDAGVDPGPVPVLDDLRARLAAS